MSETLFGYPVKVVDKSNDAHASSAPVFATFDTYKKMRVLLTEDEAIDCLLNNPENTLTREQIQQHFDALKR